MKKLLTRLKLYLRNPIPTGHRWQEGNSLDHTRYLGSETGKSLCNVLSTNEIEIHRWAINQHGNREWSCGVAAGYRKAVADIYNLAVEHSTKPEAADNFIDELLNLNEELKQKETL